MAFAAPANLIKNYYSFADILEMTIIAVDYSGNSSYQWLKRTASTETDFVLQINEENSIITIMNHGVLLLQRTINYGTDMLAEAVIESQVFQVNEMSAALEVLQKEELLRPHLDLSMNREDNTTVTPGMEYIRLQEAKDMITESMQLFVNNISRVIEYQATRNRQLNTDSNIKEITITGVGAQINGLNTLVSNELSLPIRENEKLMDVYLVGNKHVAKENINEFITCFGACLAPANFIPQDYIVIEQKRDFWKLYLGLGVGTLAACSVLSITSISNYRAALKEQEQLKTEIRNMEYIEEKWNEYNTTKKALNSLIVMDEGIYNPNEEFNSLLEQLEDKLPSSSLVHSITADNQGFTMSISTTSKAVAGQLLLQLQEIDCIQDISISGLTETVDQETMMTEVTFTVTCTYKNQDVMEVN